MQTDYLANWNVVEEQRKADFMEHMYKCSGRTNGLYTGLWEEFCIKEAGPYCRNMYFERLEAIAQYELQLKLQEEAAIKEAEDFKFGIEQAIAELDVTSSNEGEFVPTFHD
jgi:hypothetical protein